MKQIVGVFIKDSHLTEDTIDQNKSIYQQALNLCTKHKCPLFNAGDVFTERKSQPLVLLNAFEDILESYQYAGVRIHLIPGNHDKVDQEDERSYINAFKNYPNLHLYQRETSLEFANNVVVHFIPYFKENGSYLERLESLKRVEGKFNLCLTHIAVESVRNNDGTLVQNQIKKELFEKFDLTMVGHYHDESWIGDKIWYFPGCKQKNFGENNRKGFVLLYNDGSYDFIKSQFQEYIQVKLDILDVEGIKKAQEKYQYSTEKVKFVFKGDKAELMHVDKAKFESLGINVDFEKDSAVPLNADDLVQKANHLSFNRGNIFEAFDTFCETKHIEDNSIGKTYLEKI